MFEIWHCLTVKGLNLLIEIFATQIGVLISNCRCLVVVVTSHIEQCLRIVWCQFGAALEVRECRLNTILLLDDESFEIVQLSIVIINCYSFVNEFVGLSILFAVYVVVDENADVLQVGSAESFVGFSSSSYNSHVIIER